MSSSQHSPPPSQAIRVLDSAEGFQIKEWLKARLHEQGIALQNIVHYYLLDSSICALIGLCVLVFQRI